MLTVTLLATVGCNNQRNNRLSALNACGGSANAIDPTAFELTEKQATEVFDAVDPVDFPDGEALAVKSIVSTFEIVLDNEELSTVRIVSSNVQGNPKPTINCTKNITIDSFGMRIIEIPVSNTNGKIQLKKFKIEIGNSTKEDKSDFLRLTAFEKEPPVDENVDEEAGPAEPIPFSTYFSAEQDQVAYYKIKVGDKDERSAEEILKQDYFIHYKNDTNRVRSRITVTRIIK